MEEFRIAPEIDEELQRLRKKDRLYIWICAIILSIILTAVVGMYLNYRPSAARSAGRAGNASPALNSSTVLAAGRTGATGTKSRVVKAGAGGEANHGGARCGYGGGSSCCGSPRGSGAQTDDRSKRLTDMALAKFRTEVGHLPVTARVTEYGCHIQIDIYNGSKVIRRYGYQGGVLYEIK